MAATHHAIAFDILEPGFHRAFNRPPILVVELYSADGFASIGIVLLYPFCRQRTGQVS